MLEDDLAALQALGPGGLDVLLIDGVQHGRPGQPGSVAHGIQAQREARHEIGLGAQARIKDRRQLQILEQLRPNGGAEQDQQEGCHDETRHGDAQRTDHAQQTVHPPSPVIGRQTAQQDPDYHGPGQGDHADFGGDGEHVHNDLGHRASLLHLQGFPQIAVQRVFQVIHHLNGQRLVKAVLCIQCGLLLRRQRFFRGKRAARHRHHQQEGDTGHDEDRNDRHNDSLQYVLCHFFTS